MSTTTSSDQDNSSSAGGPEPDAHGARSDGGSTPGPQNPAAAPEDAARAVRLGGVAISTVILLSLAWYLLADRYTPYTTQARVAGYVVGVAPEVAGTIAEVWVKNNQDVAAGQKLFAIDDSQYRIALAKANADLDSARRQVGAGSASVEAARANLSAAQANELKARQDAARLARLYEEDPGTISVRRLEVSRASLEQARAQVRAAQADIQRAIEQMGGADAESNTILNTALTAVEKAELDLANTVVTAPARGLITDLRADIGQFAGAGSPVMTLISIHDVWITAEFTENNLGNLRVGSPVEIVFDVLPGNVFEGRVRSIGLGVSAGQAPPAGTLPTIDNDRNWLRQAQRFPVIVGFDPGQESRLREQLRIGGQASVMAFSDGHGVLALLGKGYLRFMSWLSYLG
jgi:multidrug resistance efflux pump